MSIQGLTAKLCLQRNSIVYQEMSERKIQETRSYEAEVVANRYRIEKRLSKTNKGSTYLVADMKNNEEFFTMFNKNEMKEIFREESVLSKLDNPYILKYHESFLNNENICIVTEYCEGGDLEQRMKKLKKRGEKLPEEKILHWFVQLLSGCHYMHSQHVLHRNIKPCNIFLKKDIIKIGDFGIARILKGVEDATTFIGTPYYMSPESDIWSIGCVLYEMATYQHPFVGDNMFEIFNSVVKDNPPSINHLYSRDLNRILKIILTKNPSERPSASDLLNEDFISNYVKMIIQKSLECARTPSKMAALINSLAALNEIIDDDAFGEYDDRSTLKPTPKGSLRSTLRDDDDDDD